MGPQMKRLRNIAHFMLRSATDTDRFELAGFLIKHIENFSRIGVRYIEKSIHVTTNYFPGTIFNVE
jgi:hypothetical protein